MAGDSWRVSCGTAGAFRWPAARRLGLRPFLVRGPSDRDHGKSRPVVHGSIRAAGPVRRVGQHSRIGSARPRLARDHHGRSLPGVVAGPTVRSLRTTDCWSAVARAASVCRGRVPDAGWLAHLSGCDSAWKDREQLSTHRVATDQFQQRGGNAMGVPGDVGASSGDSTHQPAAFKADGPGGRAHVRVLAGPPAARAWVLVADRSVARGILVATWARARSAKRGWRLAVALAWRFGFRLHRPTIEARRCRTGRSRYCYYPPVPHADRRA